MSGKHRGNINKIVMNYKRSPISGYEGYEVDTNGEVWSSLERKNINHVQGVAWSISSNPIRKLRTQKWRLGYVGAALYKNGIQKRISVHRLVAEAFIPNPDNKPCVCHKDNNRANNKVDNLYWGTQKENMQDMFKFGTVQLGEKSKGHVLTEKQVRVIKWAMHYGATYWELAKMFKMRLTTFQAIRDGNTWRWVILA